MQLHIVIKTPDLNNKLGILMDLEKCVKEAGGKKVISSCRENDVSVTLANIDDDEKIEKIREAVRQSFRGSNVEFGERVKVGEVIEYLLMSGRISNENKVR